VIYEKVGKEYDIFDCVPVSLKKVRESKVSKLLNI